MHAGKQGDVVDAVIGCADAWQCFGTRDFLRLVIDMINIVLHVMLDTNPRRHGEIADKEAVLPEKR